MNKEFVTYEQALALQELGFYEHCMGFYYYAVPELRWMLQISSDYHKIVSIIDAPLKQQVFKWFREKYNVDCYITRILPNVVNRDIYHIVLNDLWAPNDSYKNYEDAESRLIDNLIELAKQQDNGMEVNN
jgi:hypothetical protein